MTGTEAGTAGQRPPDPLRQFVQQAFCQRPADWLLLLGLQAAVPLVIGEIANLTPQQRQEIAPDCGQVIAEHGDVLMYGGKGCAQAFNKLAKGLGVLAYQPGGVVFAGLHWCVGSHHNGTPDEAPCAAEIAREATETNHDNESEAQ